MTRNQVSHWPGNLVAGRRTGAVPRTAGIVRAGRVWRARRRVPGAAFASLTSPALGPVLGEGRVIGRCAARDRDMPDDRGPGIFVELGAGFRVAEDPRVVPGLVVAAEVAVLTHLRFLAAPAVRLGNGQLRRQVAEWLAARPGPHTPGEIAKGLGRSAGAVGNALTTLPGRGEAGREPGKPVRYRANTATAAAAAAITPRAPAPPRPAPAPAAPRPPAAPKPAVPGPVTRPGGQVYQPRALADMPDV